MHELLNGYTVAISAQSEDFFGEFGTSLWGLLDSIAQLQVHHLIVVWLVRRSKLVVSAPVNELLDSVGVVLEDLHLEA